jgi:hypothetical protein
MMMKRRPGGYGGYVGRENRQTSRTPFTFALSDGGFEITIRTIPEPRIPTVTTDSEIHSVSEDGCLISGYVVSSEPQPGN